MTETYYIYKLRVKGTKLFYIGITNNSERRMVQHFSDIRRVVRRLRGSGSSINLTSIPAHLAMAKAIIFGKKSRILKNKFINSRLVFTVLHSTSSLIEASEKEDSIVAKSLHKEGFLNSTLKSACAYTRLRQPVLEKSA